MATREIGLLVIELGGGLRQAADAIDHRVGFSEVVALGTRVRAGDPLAVVHAPLKRGGEVASMPGMLGDDQAIGECAGAVFEQVDCLGDRIAVFDGKSRFVHQAAQRKELRSLALAEG